LRRDLWLVAAAAVLLGGCSARNWKDSWRRLPSPDDVVAQVPWFQVMHYPASIPPYAMMRPPVEGTVPVNADIQGYDVTPANQKAIDAIKNPVSASDASLARGRNRFLIFCQPCHGANAAGDGPVNTKLLVAPSLLTDKAKALSDGYIYSMIRRGRGIMPAYGDRIFGNDRWDIVNYVRQLQRGSQ
jgi:mono/diheme cytochrome c family protein